jgi:hypothetical protein
LKFRKDYLWLQRSDLVHISFLLYPHLRFSPSPNSSPVSRSWPGTALTAFTTVRTISPPPLASAPASRPGTGDSTGSISHHRLHSIRGTNILQTRSRSSYTTNKR